MLFDCAPGGGDGVSTGGAPACASAPDCAVSDVGNAIVAIMSLVIAQPLSSAAADATNKADVRGDRRTVCCTPPRYRLPNSAPGLLVGGGYLIAAVRSPDIAASCGPQLDHACSPPAGMSKWPLRPLTER